MLVLNFRIILADLSSNQTEFPNRSERSISLNENDNLHVHIWNDVDNRENHFSNIFQESKDSNRAVSDTTPISYIQQDPTPLDQFKKSDQNLYRLFYKLNTKRDNLLKLNYYPSIVNYVPQAFKTNINSYSSVHPTNPVRHTLYEQLHDSNNFIRNYYTNLHKIKTTKPIYHDNSVDWNRMKYGSRVMVDEPTPKAYRAFQLYEPIPGQVLLPPTRIPLFKPVPPPMKTIPVFEDYLEPPPLKLFRPAHHVFRYATTPKIYPFYEHEAMTMPSLQSYMPVTERYQLPHTEPYHRLETTTSTTTTKPITMPSITIATKPSSSPTKATYPSVVYAVPVTSNGVATADNGSNEQQQHNYNELVHGTKHKFGSDKHKIKFNKTDQNGNSFDQTKLVSMEQMRPTFYQQQQQQHEVNSMNEFSANHNYKNTEPFVMKQKKNKTKTKIANLIGARPPKNETATNEKMPGFRIVVNDYYDERQEDIGMNISMNTGEKLIHMKHDTVIYGKHRTDLPVQPPTKNLSAEPVQVSPAYSKRIYNHHQKYVNKEIPKEPQNSQEELLLNLTNDIKRVLALPTTATEREPISIIDMNSDEDNIEINTNKNDHINKHMMLSDPILNDHEQNVDRSDSFINSNNRDDLTNNHITDDDDNAVIVVANKTETKHDVNNKQTMDNKYYKWYSDYADEHKRKFSRAIISEHFKKVEIEPNVAWVILPR